MLGLLSRKPAARKPSASTSRRTRRTFAPSVGNLEDRKLLAASIAFDAPGGLLVLRADVGESNASLAPSTTTPGNIVAKVDGLEREFTAAEVKIVFFFASAEGGDSFANSTSELTIGYLYGSNNAYVGGLGSDIVFDYAGDSDVDSFGGAVNYIDASDYTVGHGMTVTTTRSGGYLVRAY